MTVSSPNNRIQYETNGTTGPWTVPFKFLQNSHLLVVYADEDGVETTLVLDTDYSVSGAGNETGTVTTTDSYVAGGTITIVRDVPYTQETDYGENDPFPANTHEMRLDWLTMIVQQLSERLDRAIGYPVSDAASGVLIPGASDRALKTWTNDADGNLVMTTPAAGTADALASDLIANNSATRGVGMSGYGPAVQYGANTIGALMGKVVVVDLYGASTSASAATNDAAFASALAVLSASGFGGKIVCGRGQYQLSQTLVIDEDDVEIVGVGSAWRHNPASPAETPGGTQLVFTNTTGAGVHLKGQGCGLRGVVVTSDAARYASAYATTKPGILVEADDVVGGGSRRTRIEDCHVFWQPGDGIVMIGELVQSTIKHVDIDNLKGIGLVIDDGTYTGRTNVERPGQIGLEYIRISRNGGQAMRIGDPTQGDNGRPYRIGGYMIECFLNRTDSVTFPDAYNWMVGGENMQFELCATGGEEAVGVPDHAGIYTWGLYNRFTNHRFVDNEICCAYIDDPAGAGGTTRDIVFEQVYINNENHGAGYYDPAFIIDPGCDNVRVTYHGNSSDVTTLITDDYGQHEVEEGGIKDFQGTYIARGFKSNRDAISIGDDVAVAVLFPAAARGVLLFSSSAEAGNTFMVCFRCGDGSAFLNIPISSGTGTVTDGGVGVLTGTTGVDGQITVKVDNALNKVYVENRSGSTRTYFVTLLSSNSDIQSIT